MKSCSSAEAHRLYQGEILSINGIVTDDTTDPGTPIDLSDYEIELKIFGSISNKVVFSTRDCEKDNNLFLFNIMTDYIPSGVYNVQITFYNLEVKEQTGQLFRIIELLEKK